jgi:hypothetical protein
MADMMRRASDRLPAESLRTESQQGRTVSHPLRIDAKGSFLSAVNEARTSLGKSIEAMAIDAGCPVSAMSDALAGKDSRNFAGHWLIAQGAEFVAKYNAIVDRQLGLTPASVDAIDAEQIASVVEMLVRRGFRARTEAAS